MLAYNLNCRLMRFHREEQARVGNLGSGSVCVWRAGNSARGRLSAGSGRLEAGCGQDWPPSDSKLTHYRNLRHTTLASSCSWQPRSCATPVPSEPRGGIECPGPSPIWRADSRSGRSSPIRQRLCQRREGRAGQSRAGGRVFRQRACGAVCLPPAVPGTAAWDFQVFVECGVSGVGAGDVRVERRTPFARLSHSLST